jgi:hypothetical protein
VAGSVIQNKVCALLVGSSRVFTDVCCVLSPRLDLRPSMIHGRATFCSIKVPL